MARPARNNILLELHVPDFEKVKEFYEKLGFEVVWERKPEEKKVYLGFKTVPLNTTSILVYWW